MPEESAECEFDGQKTIRKKDKEEQAVERPNDDDPEYLAQIMQQQQQHITTPPREHTHNLEEAVEGRMEKKQKCHNLDSKRRRRVALEARDTIEQFASALIEGYRRPVSIRET